MLLPPGVRSLICLALEEDLGRGDLSALAVPADASARAKIVAKSDLIVSGTDLISTILEEARVPVDWLEIDWKDGAQVKAGTEIANIKANARAILGVERTILNFLQRTFGVATQAAEFKKRIGDRKLRVVDTRKTAPGWRYLDKMAVRHGGLWNHRFGLDSGILLKENHIRAAGGIAKAIENVRSQVSHGVEIEVEVQSLPEAEQVIQAGVNIILLDNFSKPDLEAAIPVLRKQKPDVVLELSGNVTLEKLDELIDLDVDIISVGALTHSVSAADISMLFELSNDSPL